MLYEYIVVTLAAALAGIGTGLVGLSAAKEMDQIIDKKQEGRQIQQMIQTAVKKQGFESILYRGNGTKEKAVIVMSGSNGGMHLTLQ